MKALPKLLKNPSGSVLKGPRPGPGLQHWRRYRTRPLGPLAPHRKHYWATVGVCLFCCYSDMFIYLPVFFHLLCTILNCALHLELGSLKQWSWLGMGISFPSIIMEAVSGHVEAALHNMVASFGSPTSCGDSSCGLLVFSVFDSACIFCFGPILYFLL